MPFAGVCVAVNMQKAAVVFAKKAKESVVDTESLFTGCNNLPAQWLKYKHSSDKSPRLMCPDVLRVLTRVPRMRVGSLYGQLHILMKATFFTFLFIWWNLQQIHTFLDVHMRFAPDSNYLYIYIPGLFFHFLFSMWIIVLLWNSWDITMWNTCWTRSNCESAFVPQVKTSVECDGNRWGYPHAGISKFQTCTSQHLSRLSLQRMSAVSQDRRSKCSCVWINSD